MKSILTAAITCAILFGASFMASKYYMDAEVTEEAPKEFLEESVDQSSTLPPNQDEIQKVKMMPVAHRPEKSVSLEAVLQMSDSIKKMEAQLILREQRLAKEDNE